MRLRGYQTESKTAIFDKLRTHRSTLLELATGGGKTVIGSHVACDWPSRVIWLAHQEELIRQAAATIAKVTGEEPGIEMGQEEWVDERAMLKPKVVVSTVQTMSRPKRLSRFKPEEFGLVIIDEAHHSPCKTYRSVIAHFQQNPECRLLGITATPKRSDKVALGQVFESVAYSYGIEAMIADGYLVPIRQQVVKVDGLDFTKVRTVAGDFNADDLERIVTEEGVLHKIAAPLVEESGDAPTLVFCVSVNHARLMQMVIERYKTKSAAFLAGITDREERRETIQRFRGGDLQFLCSCNLMLEGFDAPSAAVIAMGRPTKSPVVYAQCLGRGTRPLPGTVEDLATPDERRDAIAASAKPSMLVLDFVGNAGTHKIIQAADILGGKYGIPVREAAKKIMADKGKAMSVEQALDQADAEIELTAEQEEWRRRQRIVAQAEYQTQSVSPFSRSEAAASVANQQHSRHEPPTEKQVNLLVNRFGWRREAAMKLTKAQASGAIGRLMAKGA